MFAAIRVFILWGVVLAFAVSWGGAFADEALHQPATQKSSSQRLTFAFVDFPPFSHMNKAGRPTGGAVVRALEILNEAGYDYELLEMPYKRLFHDIKESKFDVTIAYGDDPRWMDNAIKSDLMAAHIQLKSYRKVATAFVRQKSDFSDKRVGVIRGYSLAGLADYLRLKESRVYLSEVTEPEQGLRMLLHNRIDYFVNYHLNTEETLAGMVLGPIEADDILEMDLFLMVSASLPDAQLITDRVNRAYHDRLRREELGQAPKLDGS